MARLVPMTGIPAPRIIVLLAFAAIPIIVPSLIPAAAAPVVPTVTVQTVGKM